MPSPILYLTDGTDRYFDPADLFDLAFILKSSDKYQLVGVVLPENGEGERVIDALAVRAGTTGDIPYYRGATGLAEALEAAEEPVNVVAVGNFAVMLPALHTNRAQFREKVGRLFLIGGHANDYTVPRTEGERLPIDPRLKERHPERFAMAGDIRLAENLERFAFAELLTSGEGVIFLPRDICLWRYAAPHTLTDGGQLCELLLREQFYAHLQAAGPDADHLLAADAPVLLSALPALLLATQPDPMGWLRLFRAVTARVETDGGTGKVTNFMVKHEQPNLYAVVGIDGAALGKLLTQALRIRPLPGAR